MTFHPAAILSRNELIVADDLIILIEPNVDAISHADEKSTSYQVDREFSSGFQDHSGNAGTAGQ